MRQFADTFYFLALPNRRDRAHAAALRLSAEPRMLLTTEWVLCEVADAMASHDQRSGFLALYHLLRSDPAAEIVEASHSLFVRGTDLYTQRPDKDWSLTDCTSFVVMQERGIMEALTGDKHFEQAGFSALLK